MIIGAQMVDPQVAARLMDERQCGECSLCCKALHIHETKSPAGEWCRHTDPGGVGCEIYDSRPQECRTFMCLWRQGILGGDGDHLRPDRIGAVFSFSGTSVKHTDGSLFISVTAHEQHHGSSMQGHAREIMLTMAKIGMPIVVFSGERAAVVNLTVDGRDISRGDFVPADSTGTVNLRHEMSSSRGYTDLLDLMNVPRDPRVREKLLDCVSSKDDA